jgi:hypothetical protein
MVEPIPSRIHIPLVLVSGAFLAAGGAADLTIEISVYDQEGHPVPGVEVRLKKALETVSSVITDVNGRAEFTQLAHGHFDIAATKDGFEPVEKTDIDASQAGVLSLEITLAPSVVQRESVEVRGTVPPVDQGASASTEVPVQTAAELPGRPATVADALPLVPGVARTPGGGLQISGSGDAVTDAVQSYVGVPNQNRFPNFLSADARLSKDFKVSPKYTVRLSVSSYNLTDHFNPEAFHNNVGDPAYGLFFGQRRRHFTADFDVIF